MRYTKYAPMILAVLVLALLGACAPADEEAAKPEAEAPAATTDEDAIRAMVQAWADANNGEDAAAMTALYQSDGGRLTPGFPILVGAEALTSAFEASHAQFQSTGTALAVEDVKIAGDTAYARGTWSGSFTPEEGGETQADNGKWLAVVKRQADGSWKLAVDGFNSELEAPGS